MFSFDTVEGEILFAIYKLYQSNKITLSQKNDMKDLLITQDRRMTELMQEFKSQRNSSELESSLIDLTSENSPVDLDESHSTYKRKRPQRFVFPNSNFTKILDSRPPPSLRDTDSMSNSIQINEIRFMASLSPVRKRIYSVAADSC